MNPRQLPVIYVRPDMMMQLTYFTLSAIRETDVAYGPQRLCITCVNFKAFRYRGQPGGFSCAYPLGLKGAKQDGTSFCSYHVERTT